MLQSRRLPHWPPYPALLYGKETLPKRRQQQHRLGKPPAGESVLGGPIFRGGCWDMLEGDDLLDSCLVSSVESEHGAEQERCFGKLVTGIQGSESDNRGTDNDNTQASVRFHFGNTTIAATAASNHEEATSTGLGANATSAACRQVPFVQEEEGETGDAEGGDEEYEKYVATNGQCFVARQRNGMHTAWRLQAASSNNSNTNAPPANARWENSVSADQLISLTRHYSQQQEEQLKQQHPVRLFLRRTRASLSTSATNTVETAAATGALTGSGARQIGVDSVDVRAFALPWTGRPSPMGNSKESSVQLSRGARTGAQEGTSRGGLSKVPTKPRRGCGWAPPSPAGSPEQQHQTRGISTSVPGCPTLRRLTSRASPPSTICNSRHDENSPPPPTMAACISSPTVRRNLARAARKSKVGTKADPVTLYRQRQELEQARVRNAVVRNRKKASREGRTSDGFAWAADRAASIGKGLDGRRTRAAGSVVGRVGISLR